MNLWLNTSADAVFIDASFVPQGDVVNLEFFRPEQQLSLGVTVNGYVRRNGATPALVRTLDGLCMMTIRFDSGYIAEGPLDPSGMQWEQGNGGSHGWDYLQDIGSRLVFELTGNEIPLVGDSILEWSVMRPVLDARAQSGPVGFAPSVMRKDLSNYGTLLRLGRDVLFAPTERGSWSFFPALTASGRTSSWSARLQGRRGARPTMRALYSTESTVIRQRIFPAKPIRSTTN